MSTSSATPQTRHAMRDLFRRVGTDRYAGALMFLFGIAAAAKSVDYKIGTISHMGPGLFPAAIGSLLALTGVAIFFAKDTVAPDHTASGRAGFEWRSWTFLCLGLVAFIVLGEYGGLVPATFALVFLSACADRENTVLHAFVLALVMVAICVIVFWWLLQVQFPLFRWM